MFPTSVSLYGTSRVHRESQCLLGVRAGPEDKPPRFRSLATVHQIGSWVSKPSRLCIKRTPGVVVCPRSFALVRQMSLILCACTTDGLLEWSYTPDSSRLCVTLAPVQNPNKCSRVCVAASPFDTPRITPRRISLPRQLQEQVCQETSSLARQLQELFSLPRHLQPAKTQPCNQSPLQCTACRREGSQHMSQH